MSAAHTVIGSDGQPGCRWCAAAPERVPAMTKRRMAAEYGAVQGPPSAGSIKPRWRRGVAPGGQSCDSSSCASI